MNLMEQLIKDRNSLPVELKVGQVVYDPNFGFDTVGKITDMDETSLRLDMDSDSMRREKRTFRPVTKELLGHFARNAGFNLQAALDTQQRLQRYLVDAP